MSELGAPYQRSPPRYLIYRSEGSIMVAVVKPVKIEQFKGLNNRIDPTRLGLEWQLDADNVLCDDAGYLIQRPGWEELGIECKDAWATPDGRLFIITPQDQLARVNVQGHPQVRRLISLTILHDDITGGPFRWALLGQTLFLQSDVAQWAISPNRVIPWGSLCPVLDATAPVLEDPISHPPPVGVVLGTRRNQVAVGVWEPHFDRSAVFFSRPDYPHEFRLERDFLLVAGRVNLLAFVSQGMVIGTDRAIFFDAIDLPLAKVADYGSRPEGAFYSDMDTVFFWTDRGLCKVAPFENLTDDRLVIEHHDVVTGALLPWQGSVYAIISQVGALATQSMAVPHTPLPIEIIHDHRVFDEGD